MPTILLTFFFSSRRRHTRSKRDWSSDVCSSDLWIEFPIYFVTACTFRRRPMLARDAVAAILVDELRGARERHGWVIGSYVVMPDHMHFFCAPEYDGKTLTDFMREWKSWTSRRVNALRPRPTTAATTLCQREFFRSHLAFG